MLSARTIYGEIFDNDEAFGLFCSIAASGEAQGGWENGKIAALVPGSQAGLAAKIARHGADEDKHGRILGWRRPEAAVLAAGIRGVYACERPGGWRRMVALRMPARRNALGGPVPAQPSHA